MTVLSQSQAQPQGPSQSLPDDLPFRVISRTIGQGAYAFIRKAAPKNDYKPVIAVKFINKHHAYTLGRVKPKQIQAEVALHNHVGKHTNIIQFLSSGEDANWAWIAMELAAGDLFDKIEADVGIGEDVAHFYFSQLISAVGYMHSRNVAHRDIKPENILLAADGDLKMSDFGLAVLFGYDGRKKLCQTVCGSPPYMAPEVVPKEGFTGRKTEPYEGNIADVWSCGIVLFVLLVGNTPWDEPTMSSPEYADYINSGGSVSEDELWNQVPLQARSLLRGILRPDPASRMTLEDVRRHPWFTRPNQHLRPDGRAANPVGLATKMLENLHINFQADPSVVSSQRQASAPQRRKLVDSMDIDSNSDHDMERIALTQPDTMVTDLLVAWERPARPEHVSASQPLTGAHASLSVQDRLADRFTQDPSLSQFAPTPSVPLSVTQAARRFHDILPSYSLTRFLSFMDFSLLLPLLCEALGRQGVAARAQMIESNSQAVIPIKTRDQRRCLLAGKVFAERIEEEVIEVRFLKATGDPLEWRRLFKRVAILCKDAILKP